MRNTPSLPELQRQFAAALLEGVAAPIIPWVLGNGLTPDARLQIYRNIVSNNHAAALRTAFPAVLKLVGEDFFEVAAVRYMRDCPTASGNLQDYGSEFAEFLSHMPEASGLAYLPDVARLEWMRQESYLAADADTTAIDALADVDDPEKLRLRLHPSLRLLASDHPVLDIWQFCQQPAAEHLELSRKRQYVIIWRDTAQIAMQEVAADRFVFLEALQNRKRLTDAHEQAIGVAKDFDLSVCLHWLFATGLVTGLSIA